jgi:hypothetical protein
MNAPRQAAPNQSNEHTPTQPRQDEDKKHPVQSKPDKPERQDQHENERQPAHKK